MEEKAKVARQKAIKFRKKGNHKDSREQMKLSLTMNARSNNINNFFLKLDSYSPQLEQANSVEETLKTIKEITRLINHLSLSIPVPEVTSAVDDFLSKIPRWEDSHDMTEVDKE